MTRQKNIVIFILLFSFVVLYAKALFPALASSAYDNCDEIGHIHNFKVHKNVNNIPVVKTDSSDDEDCHEGKSIFTFMVACSKVSIKAHEKFPTLFKLVWTVENNFKTPYLEPRRKPPREV